MGKRIFLYGLIALFIVFAVSGCETVPKKFKQEVSGIKTRVDTLESRVDTVEAKQSEVERAASEQSQAIEDLRSTGAKSNISTKARSGKVSERVKDIQICLKNAGFYNGSIDGIKGKKTRKGIRDFQSANGLKADGIVGPRTWALLSKYSAGGFEYTEEGAK